MNSSYVLSCESTVDLPYTYVNERGISVLFYSYTVDGREYEDDMGRDSNALPRFYRMLSDGAMPSTSQLNVMRYAEYFEDLLSKGDILHIAFGSGMTNSVFHAREAAELVMKKHPERRILVVDSLCSSSGYGLMVDQAADLRDEGRPMTETAAWCESHANRIHHQFYSTRLDMYRRSGRMSGAAATVATVLNICPLLRLNAEGRIVAYSKVRGKKAAVEATVEAMAEHAMGGKAYAGKCFICHSDCPEDALATKEAVEEAFPRLRGKIRICDIGTIIASHCGPGTVAVFFLGDARGE